MPATRAARPGPAEPTRIHVLGHANPSTKDFARLGVKSGRALLDLIRSHLPAPLRLTGDAAILEAAEDQNRGGRRDDTARIRDVQHALNDANTKAIIALNGGAYFSRIMPHLDFTPLARRQTPLFASGFSEMTSFVNIIATYPRGRGMYWLCPNYLGWKIKPVAAAHAAYGEFWRRLPEFFARYEDPRAPWTYVDASDTKTRLQFGAIRGELAHGAAKSGEVRLIGGCLSVLASFMAGALGRRLRPRGRWLVIEDVNEAPYRVDRYLAALTVAGWFDQLAGVIIGDFHSTDAADQRRAVLEMLRFHLPKARNVPVLLTRDIGHVWPMMPLLLGQPQQLTVRKRKATIDVH